jgi:hypothetical protein
LARLGLVLAGLCGILLAPAGCNQNPQITGGKLSGTVTYKGAPLPGGEIRLLSPSDPNKSQGGPIRADGTYEVLNAPLGQVKVLIDTEMIKSHPALMADKVKPGAGNPKVEMNALYGGQLKYVQIPDRYRDAGRTPLTATVEKGSSKKDFNLE